MFWLGFRVLKRWTWRPNVAKNSIVPIVPGSISRCIKLSIAGERIFASVYIYYSILGPPLLSLLGPFDLVFLFGREPFPWWLIDQFVVIGRGLGLCCSVSLRAWIGAFNRLL